MVVFAFLRIVLEVDAEDFQTKFERSILTAKAISPHWSIVQPEGRSYSDFCLKLGNVAPNMFVQVGFAVKLCVPSPLNVPSL